LRTDFIYVPKSILNRFLAEAKARKISFAFQRDQDGGYQILDNFREAEDILDSI